MRILLIESIGRPIEKDFSKTSVAHARNSVILSDILEADIITCERDMHLAENKTYDHIICCYASPYMKYKKLIDVVWNNPNAKLWWLVNDHDLEDNILLRNVLKATSGKRKINMICNNPRSGYRGWILRKKIKDIEGNLIGLLDDFIEEWHTVNLNTLIYSYEIDYDWSQKTEDLIYYGTMRKWRLDYLKHYQHAEMTLSSTTRTQKKFIERGVDKCQMVDKLSWQRGKEDLTKYKFSLYIEDDHTHENYAFMANRFYEALMCNTINIFDANCVNNIKQSGYNISDEFIVSSIKEIKALVDKYSTQAAFEDALSRENDIHKIQARQEHLNTVKQIRGIFYESN